MAAGQVQDIINSAQSAAEEAWARAMTELGDVGSVRILPYNPNLSLDASIGGLGSFSPVTFRESNTLENYVEAISFGGPEDVTITVDPPSIAPAPVFDVEAFQAREPKVPGITDPTPIQDPGEITDPDLPPAPEEFEGELPDLLEITDPGEIEIRLPEFTAQPPTEVPEDVVANPTFTNERYASDMLATLQAKVTQVLNSGTGLPQAIQDALFERAVWIQDRENMRARRQVAKDIAARGFSRPTGAMARALSEIEKAGLEARSRLNQEQWLERWRQEVEEIREYTRIGVTLEQALIQEHIAYYEREIQHARLLLDATIQIFQAKVQRYQLRIEIFRIQAEQYRVELEAALAPLQELRAKVDVMQAKGSVNQSIVDRYRAEVDAHNQKIAAYNALVQAQSLIVQNNNLRIDRYRARLEGSRTEVAMQELKLRKYAEEVRAESTRADTYATRINAYAQRVAAYRTEADVEIAKANNSVRKGELDVSVFQARIGRAQAETQAAVDQLQGAVASLNADIQKFSAEVRQKEAESNAKDRKAELRLSESRAKADVAIASARLVQEELISSRDLVLRASETSAQVAGQLAAAARNAVNAAATLSEAECAA